jgi:hypothetical protein
VKGKYPQFKYWLAMTFFAPSRGKPRSSTRSRDGGEEPHAQFLAGRHRPFMQTEYIENRRHVLERNPNFHGETYPCEGEPGDKEKGYLADCGKPIPFVDKVVFDSRRKACRCRRNSCRATTTRRRSSGSTTAPR